MPGVDLGQEFGQLHLPFVLAVHKESEMGFSGLDRVCLLLLIDILELRSRPYSV